MIGLRDISKRLSVKRYALGVTGRPVPINAHIYGGTSVGISDSNKFVSDSLDVSISETPFSTVNIYINDEILSTNLSDFAEISDTPAGSINKNGSDSLSISLSEIASNDESFVTKIVSDSLSVSINESMVHSGTVTWQASDTGIVGFNEKRIVTGDGAMPGRGDGNNSRRRRHLM